MSDRAIPANLVELFETIKFAITNRRQVILTYGGLRREVCPHSLGWKHDQLSCFAFQFAGGSRQPLPPGGQWRCLHLRSMSEVTVREGDWHTGPIDPQSSSCIDDFEAYVGYPMEWREMTNSPKPDAAVVEALTPLVDEIVALIDNRLKERLDPLLVRIQELERVVASQAVEGDDTPPDNGAIQESG